MGYFKEKYEFPCGLKIEVVVDSFNLEVVVDSLNLLSQWDLKNAVCPIHGTKCK